MLSNPDTGLGWTIWNAQKNLPKVPEPIRLGAELKTFCTKLRRTPSAEILAAELRGRTAFAGAYMIGYSVGPYRLDLGFREVLLGVEIRSGQWGHADFGTMQATLKREQYLARMGWTLLRFTEAQVARRPKAAADKIVEAYGMLEA